MRYLALLIAAMLISSCASLTATPTATLTPSPTVTPTHTPPATILPPDLSFIEELAAKDILIQYDVEVGFSSDMAYLAPRFILYANGSVIYARDSELYTWLGLYQTNLSNQQVREMMERIYQLGIENIRGYTYEQGCVDGGMPVEEGLACMTDGSDGTLRVRIGEFSFHTAVAYNGNQPASSKLDDALQLLSKYQSNSQSLYQPESSTVVLYLSEPFMSGLPTLEEWPLAPELLTEDPIHQFTIDAEQTAKLVELLGTNLGSFDFVDNDRQYWGWLFPNLPGVDYPDFEY